MRTVSARFASATRLAVLLAAWQVLAAVAGSANAAGSPDPASEAGEGSLQRVTFTDGRTLDVLGVAIREGRATLRTQGGHMIAFASGRILKIESVPAPPAAPEPIDAGTPHPAVLTPRVAETPMATAVDPEAAHSPAAGDQSLEAIIREAAARYGLEVDLLAAVIAVESGYRSDAISPKGAQGLMQLMPATAKDLAVVNPFNPRENVFAGARYLRELLDKNGDQYWRALAAYNAGPGRVARYDGLPPYKETIAYIRKVIDLYASPKPIPAASAGPR